MPLVAAAEDYAQCRKLLGDVPLRSAVEEFLRRTRGVKLGVTVPQLVEELLAAKKQDGMSDHYMAQLRSVLGIFSRAYPGPVLDVKAEQTRRLAAHRQSSLPQTRNNRLTTLRLLFNFAKQRNYLPASEDTAAEQVPKVKVKTADAEIFQPDEMEKVLLGAPALLIPYLAISAFAGLRGAELSRLDWSAVDLERRLIQLRAGQAKTASRRIVPISDNLAVWLEPLEREGQGHQAKGRSPKIGRSRQGSRPLMASERPAALLHLLPPGEAPGREPSGPRGRELPGHRVQALQGTGHRGGGRAVVFNPAEGRTVVAGRRDWVLPPTK